ncbi:MAG: rhodanese-like domain-containing protein [Bacteroidota bacterium]
MKSITVVELQEWINQGEDFQLVDVREPYEFSDSNLKGVLIPLGEIPNRYTEISKDKKVVVHCKAGMRSANAIQYLQEAHGYTNLYNLEGGMISWVMNYGKP